MYFKNTSVQIYVSSKNEEYKIFKILKQKSS